MKKGVNNKQVGFYVPKKSNNQEKFDDTYDLRTTVLVHDVDQFTESDSRRVCLECVGRCSGGCIGATCRHPCSRIGKKDCACRFGSSDAYEMGYCQGHDV